MKKKAAWQGQAATFAPALPGVDWVPRACRPADVLNHRFRVVASRTA